MFLIAVGLFSGLLFIFLKRPQSFEVNSSFKALVAGSSLTNEQEISPLSGLPCENYQRRPIAVMLSSDDEARPLSGLSVAELVIEMPIFIGGATRLMAIYVCDLPEEIGSIRSARHDFIPLAQGLDAIFLHWGGSYLALDLLSQDLIDDIDALSNPFDTFYRKTTIAKPHNGFTDQERILKACQGLNYRLSSNLEPYAHQETKSNGLSITPSEAANAKTGLLKIGYPGEFALIYHYDSKTNQYLRWRNEKEEIDRNNLIQITASVVVVMRTGVYPLTAEYNQVVVEGRGQCQVFQNGQVQDCIWHKDKNNLDSKLKFLDATGAEIKFIPGQIWLEIVASNQEVSWTAENRE